MIHHGLLLGDDGKKLSKRHGHASVADLRAEGIPAAAVRSVPRGARAAGARRPPRPGSNRPACDRGDRGHVGRRARCRRRGGRVARARAPRRAHARRGARDRADDHGARTRCRSRPRRSRPSSASSSFGRARAVSTRRVRARSSGSSKRSAATCASLRLALTGADRGPELWTVVAALPEDEALARAARAACPTEGGHGRLRSLDAPVRHPDADTVELPHAPGPIADVLLRADRLPAHPHRQRGAVRPVDVAQALARRWRATRRRSSSTSRTSTTRSTTRHPARAPRSQSARHSGTSRTPIGSASGARTSSRPPSRPFRIRSG